MSCFDLKSLKRESWLYRCWTIFFNYGLKMKNYSNEKNILVPIESLEKIPNNSIILCPEKMSDKYTNYLLNERNFKFRYKSFNMIIYEN